MENKYYFYSENKSSALLFSITELYIGLLLFCTEWHTEIHEIQLCILSDNAH